MIGDVLLINQKHERVSREIAANIELKKKTVIAIGGESGSGKSEIAETLLSVLKKEGYRVKTLHLDNYYKISPEMRNEHRRKNGPSSIGLHEINWDILEQNIEAFRSGTPSTIPFLDLNTNQEDKLITDFNKVDVLLVEGLYACNAPVDISVFIDVTYHKTRLAQIKRGKEKMDKFRLTVLEKEHQVVQKMRPRADFFITESFGLVKNGGKLADTKELEPALLICSDTLPVKVKRKQKGFAFERQLDGIATAIDSFYKTYNSTWFGQCRIPGSVATVKEKNTLKRQLKKEYRCYPVFCPENKTEKDFQNFCRKTLWPILHSFAESTAYYESWWDAYRKHNELYFKQISRFINSDDTIWIHGYQLLLLPALIRKEFPNVKIGFFLHSPFPSFEMFRLLPWRKELLTGILGADMIGFHTYDYVRHFLSSVYRILGHEHNMGTIHAGEHLVATDAIPLGIDFERYSRSHKDPNIQNELSKLQRKYDGIRLVLSVDRLDFTRGIMNKLHIINQFFRDNPVYRGKLLFRINLTPTRFLDDRNLQLKKNVEKMVREINKNYAKGKWEPIEYTAGYLTQAKLIALYHFSHIMLVTSIREGLNLMAKEYVACCTDNKGFLILSEMAGGATELSEAIQINPNNYEEVAQALRHALEAGEEEQIRANKPMRMRLERNTAIKWAVTFLDDLKNVRQKQNELKARLMSPVVTNYMLAGYHTAKSRLLVIDYNGTLAPIQDPKNMASPAPDVLKALSHLCADTTNTIVIISNLEKELLDAWFSAYRLDMITASDTWYRKAGEKWENTEVVSSDWKKTIQPVLENYVMRAPGSYVREMPFSLTWHYEKCDRDLGFIRARELSENLNGLTSGENLQINEGPKIIEIKNSGLFKGRLLSNYLELQNWDFILAAGDDWSNEYMFQLFSGNAFTIRIGISASQAKYNVENQSDFIKLLSDLANTNGNSK